MELSINNSSNKLTLADEIFSSEYNESLIHQVVTGYLAARRAGTKAQKTRAEVSGGGAKPWRQKGTGQARAGTIRSPLWRKGGKIFAAKPRSYKQKINRKMYQGAMRSILSELIRQDRLCVVDEFRVSEPKTKVLLKQLQEMNAVGHVVIVSDVIEENLYLAARNLPHMQLFSTQADVPDPVSLVKADKVIMSSAAIKVLEGLLK